MLAILCYGLCSEYTWHMPIDGFYPKRVPSPRTWLQTFKHGHAMVRRTMAEIKATPQSMATGKAVYLQMITHGLENKKKYHSRIADAGKYATPIKSKLLPDIVLRECVAYEHFDPVSGGSH